MRVPAYRFDSEAISLILIKTMKRRKQRENATEDATIAGERCTLQKQTYKRSRVELFDQACSASNRGNIRIVSSTRGARLIRRKLDETYYVRVRLIKSIRVILFDLGR